MINYYVDIDGTLTKEAEGWGNKAYSSRTPNYSVIEYVNNLPSDIYITLWTSRYSEDREVTEKWLKENNVRYDRIIFDKPQYDLLIDDKTLNPSEI